MRDVVYLGSLTQLIVELPTGDRLVVHRLNDEDAPDPAVGERVVLHWTAEHSFVIGATGARRTAAPGTDDGDVTVVAAADQGGET